jgi:hypothetical protein
MNRHYNYGIILIQKGASVLAAVQKEDYDKLNKQWKEEEDRKKGIYRSKSKMEVDSQAQAVHKAKPH